MIPNMALNIIFIYIEHCQPFWWAEWREMGEMKEVDKKDKWKRIFLASSLRCRDEWDIKTDNGILTLCVYCLYLSRSKFFRFFKSSSALTQSTSVGIDWPLFSQVEHVESVFVGSCNIWEVTYYNLETVDIGY